MMKQETIERKIRELQDDIKDIKGIVKILVAESLPSGKKKSRQ